MDSNFKRKCLQPKLKLILTSKINCLKKWPAPNVVQQLQPLIGFCNYNKDGIREFSFGVVSTLALFSSKQFRIVRPTRFCVQIMPELKWEFSIYKFNSWKHRKLKRSKGWKIEGDIVWRIGLHHMLWNNCCHLLASAIITMITLFSSSTGSIDKWKWSREKVKK